MQFLKVILSAVNVDWAGVGTVYGSFHIALVSFGSDDLNESLPWRAKVVRTDGGHEWRLASRTLSSLRSSCCSDWMLKISSSVRNNLVPFAMKSKSAVGKQFAWTADMNGDRKSLSLCCCCSDWMLKTSSSVLHEDWMQFARTVDTSGDWRVVSRHLFVAAAFWLDSVISSSVRNNLVSFDWSRTGAEHTSRPFIDSYLLA